MHCRFLGTELGSSRVGSPVRLPFTRTQVPAVHFPAGSRQETAKSKKCHGAFVLGEPQDTHLPNAFRHALLATAGAAATSSWGFPPLATTGRTLSRRRTAGKCTPGEPPYGLRHLLQRGEPAQRSGLPQRSGSPSGATGARVARGANPNKFGFIPLRANRNSFRCGMHPRFPFAAREEHARTRSGISRSALFLGGYRRESDRAAVRRR